jgi:ubiquinone/menaquinone biosynthesis C-methylase UbiE
MVNVTPNHRSCDADLLEQRIAANRSAQSIDFNSWIFQEIRFPLGGHILELCCGTGSQAVEFIRRLNGEGRYIGIDISWKALDLIREKTSPEQETRTTLLCSNMDLFGSALTDQDLHTPKFDLIFCSYGLYYSADATHLLSEMETFLKKDGQIIIVGPYGPNNELLFRILEEAGVQISEYIRYTSQGFMHAAVIPWGTLHFTSLSIRTMVNTIVWNSPDQIMEYWKNSTFFDPEKIPGVLNRLQEHFSRELTFINKKYVMMVIMKNE